MIDQYAEIIFNKKIASQTFLMALRSKMIATSAKPGQFVMIRVGSGMDPLLRRPFSICGIRGDDVFLVLYKIVGRGTMMMSQKTKGDQLSVLGTLGQGFEPPENNRVSLLVAGGIGVAPLFFLARALRGRRIHLMTGFGSLNEIIPINTITNLDIQQSISTDDGTDGHTGPVTDLLTTYLEQHAEKKEALSLFACGPIPMLKRIASMALDNNIPCHVSIEAAMACGLGACQGCAVKASSQAGRDYWHVCKDGPVFPVHAIDWNLL